MVSRRVRLNRGRLIFAALLTAFIIVGIIAAIHLISVQSGYAQAQGKYEALRLYASDAPPVPTSAPAPVQEQAEAHKQTATPEPQPDLSDINPDYIGWIRIDDTSIDYPVVSGEDNDKYLTTTFSGDKNPSGTIFMDYRCTDGWDGALTILHGHHMKDGSMFAELSKFPERGYMDEHRLITISTLYGVTLAYSIFTVVKTNIYDTAFTLHSGDVEAISGYMAVLAAPEDAQRYIALSTCTNGDDDERLLVFLGRSFQNKL